MPQGIGSGAVMRVGAERARYASHGRAQRLEFPAALWYQCAPMTDRARFYFWYYAFPKPLAEEGSRSV